MRVKDKGCNKFKNEHCINQTMIFLYGLNLITKKRNKVVLRRIKTRFDNMQISW